MGDIQQALRAGLAPAANGRSQPLEKLSQSRNQDKEERPPDGVEARRQMETAAGNDNEGPGPVGQGEHIVKQGECISSIAKDSGHFCDTIWNDPANAELEEIRKDPNVLLPGDRVTIPELQKKYEPRESEMRHRFVRRGEPAMFRIRILQEGEPRGGEPFTVDVDGKPVYSGTIAADGLVQFAIPGNANQGILRVGQGEEEDALLLDFGGIDPITEVKGVQQRLQNLGYVCGQCDGIHGRNSIRAVKSFQRDRSLEATGKLDEATRTKLAEAYGN